MDTKRPQDRREIEDCLLRYVRGVDRGLHPNRALSRRDGNDLLEHARRELGLR